MRKVFWALILCCAGSALGALPAAARDYPFCIKGCDFGSGRGDCSFSSLQQCQATASGLTALARKIPILASKRNYSLTAAAGRRGDTDAKSDVGDCGDRGGLDNRTGDGPNIRSGL